MFYIYIIYTTKFNPLINLRCYELFFESNLSETVSLIPQLTLLSSPVCTSCLSFYRAFQVPKTSSHLMSKQSNAGSLGGNILTGLSDSWGS